MDQPQRGRPLAIDHNAASASPTEPAFVTRPEGASLIVCFPSGIGKAALLGFVFHRTVAWRMDVDRGVLVAFGTGGPRKNEIRKFLRCAKLADDPHVVERGSELRTIRKREDSQHVGRCRRLVAKLLRRCCHTESKSYEEERPNGHD